MPVCKCAFFFQPPRDNHWLYTICIQKIKNLKTMQLFFFHFKTLLYVLFRTRDRTIVEGKIGVENIGHVKIYIQQAKKFFFFSL